MYSSSWKWPLLIIDRDTKFSDAFRKILEDEGVESVRLPARSPNLNPHLERFMRSVKEEALERMVFFGEKMLRAAVGQFLKHYHGERNHQGLDNKIIEPDDEVDASSLSPLNIDSASVLRQLARNTLPAFVAAFARTRTTPRSGERGYG